jgi:hypothetical protein
LSSLANALIGNFAFSLFVVMQSLLQHLLFAAAVIPLYGGVAGDFVSGRGGRC